MKKNVRMSTAGGPEVDSSKRAGSLAGIDLLLAGDEALLRGKRFGLIAHPASVDARGASSAVRLRERYGDGLAALFSPEHGFFGVAGAGDHVASVPHPSWGIPIHSLYGKTRRPAAAMLKGLDALVFDLQDLSVRCYTYVSTLRYVMEAAARAGVAVVVADRPNPLAGVVDGPMLDPRFESFVGCFPGPFVYGMTSGEAAVFLRKSLRIDGILQVAARAGSPSWNDHRWISPSPGIRNPHTAWCYPVTVGFEALPAIDYGRKTLMPFELVGAPGLDEAELADRLAAQQLPGIAFHPVVYENAGVIHHGVRMAVLDPCAYRPAASAVAVLSALQTMLGAGNLWRTPGSRPRFFDMLFGTDAVRRALQAGWSWKKIAASWQPHLRRWAKQAGPAR